MTKFRQHGIVPWHNAAKPGRISVKAFVTGATGFIGFHVVQVLMEKSVEVRSLIRETSDTSALNAAGIEWIHGDIRDREAVQRGLKGCQQVYHIAADYRLWVPDPQTMFDINVDGTRNVMECALREGVERVVYTSTVGVWGGSKEAKPLNEETPSALGDMIGDYKRSKFLAEREAYRFIEEGLPVVIVNPSAPIGPMAFQEAF